MKSLIIKSNQGNHQGFNREWVVLKEFYGYEECWAGSCLADIYNDINCLTEEDEDYQYSLSYFEDDLILYYVITEEDYIKGFFDGKHHGYASEEIINFFEN